MKHPTVARVKLRIGLLTAHQRREPTIMTKYWKAIVAAAGSLLMIWNEYAPGFADILPPSWSRGITVAVAVLTVIATFGVPNTTNDPAVAAEQSVRLNDPERPLG